MVVKQEACMIIFFLCSAVTDNSIDYRVRDGKIDPLMWSHFPWLKS